MRRQLQDSGQEARGWDAETSLDKVSSLRSTTWHHFCALHHERCPLESF